MASIIKNYINKKTKLSLVIDGLIILMVILLLIPATRKDMAALILKPTLYFHQPRISKEKISLNESTYQWKLKSTAGNELELSQLKGKVVFINYWATWCPPCIAEMPQLQKLYNDFGSQVEFLFVSNEELPIVSYFLSQKGYSIPVFVPLTEYPSDLSANSIPTTFIISKKGELVLKKSGVAAWNSRRVRLILKALVEGEQ
jgi:thiol-disulfide isomerase/thioredoxin